VAAYLAGVGIILLFAYALSWGFAVVGLSAPNSETAQIMSFPILFPLTFASSAFVPVGSMPGWLQAFAKNQPVTQVVNGSNVVKQVTVGAAESGETQITGGVKAGDKVLERVVSF